MSTQTIKDASFHIIGTIDTAADGKQTAKNSHFHIVGYYDPNANQTKNANFHIIGQGNLLASLLYCA